MDHFNGILFHKFGPANKQHTSQSINFIYKFVSLSLKILFYSSVPNIIFTFIFLYKIALINKHLVVKV